MKIEVCVVCGRQKNIIGKGMCRNCYQRDYNFRQAEAAFPGRKSQKEREKKAEELKLLADILAKVEKLGLGGEGGVFSAEDAEAIKSILQIHMVERVAELNPKTEFHVVGDDEDEKEFKLCRPSTDVKSGTVPDSAPEEFTNVEPPVNVNPNPATGPDDDDYPVNTDVPVNVNPAVPQEESESELISDSVEEVPDEVDFLEG